MMNSNLPSVSSIDETITVPRWRVWIGRLVLACYIGQINLAVAGGLVAAPNAPSGSKPIIDASGNGVPLVHIAPPSSSGVSDNRYSQFNVDSRGLILNNATQNTQTQLGGYVTPNLQFGTKPASVILNEVTGTTNSAINGFIEVAGPQAEVIVANPNGIGCNGCGFINTTRATLTTGTPTWGIGGSLTGFDVTGGQVQIGGKGLNASNIASLDIYARNLAVNGAITAPLLNVIGGANHVNRTNLSTSPLIGSGVAPTLFLDVANLGGMYANQIYLVGTEKGLGVNSDGQIAALAGNLTLSANGDVKLHDTYAKGQQQISSPGAVSLTGQTNASDLLTLNSASVLNQGQLYLNKGLALSTQSFSNTGLVALLGQTPQTIDFGQALNNQGQLVAANDLNLHAGVINGDNGQVQAVGALNVQAGSVSLNKATVQAGQGLSVSAPTLNIQNANLFGDSVQLQGSNSVSLQGSQLNSNHDVGIAAPQISANAATVTAAGAISVTATNGLETTNGTFAASGDVNLKAAQFNNNGGTLATSSNLNVVSQGLVSNQNGTFSGQKSISLSAGSLDNSAGQLLSNGSVTLSGHAGGNLASVLNTKGVVNAGQLSLHADVLNNQGGLLQGQQLVDIGAGALNNANGKIYAAQALSIAAGSLDNTAGQIGASGTGNIVTTAFNNQSGQVIGDGKLTIQSQGLSNAKGTIGGHGDLSVNTAGQALDSFPPVSSEQQAAMSLGLGPVNESAAREVGAVESNLLRSEITAPNGKIIPVVSRDGVVIPTDKVEVYARGGSPDVSGELADLQQMKQTQRKVFDLNPANQERLDQLKNMKHNYDRSQAMANNLDSIGLTNTPENNDLIMRNLLETGRSVTLDNRVWVPSTLTGPNGTLGVNSTWAILPDGTKYLSTLRFMPIGN